jgi:electron transfer flavoprotein alpha subunit
MILIFVDGSNGIKPSGLEAINFGVQLAKSTQTTATALVIGSGSVQELSTTGVNHILNYNKSIATLNDAQLLAQITADAVQKTGAKTVIFSHDSVGKAVAPRVAVKLEAGYASGATGLPTVEGSALVVKRNVFSGKAIAYVKINSEYKVISVIPNSIGKGSNESANAAIETFDSNATAVLSDVKRTEASKDLIPLPQAELVVSAGRGLKGPENWGIVEEIATTIGAATACSRPVADSHWRPHHEHVGQTGLAIRPNLYIAIGISGAIQHLAGVNSSKTIVVINKDPEAPFFKAADYGVVGDAFEVMPRLLEAFKKFKANKN